MIKVQKPSWVNILKRHVHLGYFKDCYIAGGAMTSMATNKQINDIDVYPKSKEAFFNVIATLMEEKQCFHLVHISNRSVTFCQCGEQAKPIQIMHFDEFETPDIIFDKFDFTACMCALDVDSGSVYHHDDFFEANSRRELVFNPKTLYPFVSAIRTQKYISRGYKIDRMEMFKILAACNALDISSWDDLENQLGGCYGEYISFKRGEEFTQEAVYESLSSLSFSDSYADSFYDISGDLYTCDGMLVRILCGEFGTDFQWYQTEECGKWVYRVYDPFSGELSSPVRPWLGKEVTEDEFYEISPRYFKIVGFDKEKQEIASFHDPDFKYSLTGVTSSEHPGIFFECNIDGTSAYTRRPHLEKVLVEVFPKSEILNGAAYMNKISALKVEIKLLSKQEQKLYGVKYSDEFEEFANRELNSSNLLEMW